MKKNKSTCKECKKLTDPNKVWPPRLCEKHTKQQSEGWEEEFDKKFVDNMDLLNAPDTYDEIKSFISSELKREREELITSIKKALPTHEPAILSRIEK